MYVHASERDRVPSFSHSATFSRLKGSKERSLANKTQYREYLCPSACAHGHFITKKKLAVEVAKYKTHFLYK